MEESTGEKGFASGGSKVVGRTFVLPQYYRVGGFRRSGFRVFARAMRASRRALASAQRVSQLSCNEGILPMWS